MNNQEVSPEFKLQVYSALNKAFEEVGNTVEGVDQKFEAAAEVQTNSQSGNVSMATGVQNVLITLLLKLAKELGLKENELEKVFDAVLKLIDSYKDKKGEG